MIFNSLEFAVFLGLVLGIYWTVPRAFATTYS